jgi:signal transduction histidine kinase
VLPGYALGTAVGLVIYLDTAYWGGRLPQNFIAVLPIVFYGSVAWAIFRHDLFDVDLLVRYAVGYACLTLLITGIYVGSVVLLGLMVPAQALHASPLFTIAFVVLIAVSFEPLRTRVQALVDRLFFRSRVDFRRAVGEVSAALTGLLDLDEILDRVGRALHDDLQVTSLAIVLWNDDGGGGTWRYDPRRQAMVATGPAPAPALRAQLAEAPRAPWLVPDDAGAPAEAVSEAVALGGVLVMPLTVGDEVRGAIALGAKRSGRRLSGEDVAVLRTLADQCAIATQNAISYRDLQELNRDLDEKVRARTTQLEASNAELERAYGELMAAQASLIHSEKLASLGQLVAGVAHEINNPVSFIAGNVEPVKEVLERLRALTREQSDPDVERQLDRLGRMFDIMARGAERTASIVHDLRTFSRVGESSPCATDLREGIDVSLRILRPRWTGRIAVHTDYGDVPPVEAVPGQLNQVFMNVLGNAGDAITGEGNVWITTRADTDTVTVRDDGPGIPPALQGRIFDPFFTTKPQGKGTGLGLSISHGIVTEHGGTIDVQSVPGAGTTFTIVLPRQQARAHE